MTTTELARRPSVAIAVPEPAKPQANRRYPIASVLIIATFPTTFAAMAILGASKPTRAGVILAVGLLGLAAAVVLRVRSRRT